MPIDFEELDHARTPLGILTLWRRRVPSLDDLEVYEVRLDGAFLMSSLVNASEIALAELALDGIQRGDLNVAVGGLGLGHTALAALDHHAVQSVVVIESLSEVIGWHRRGLVPLAKRLHTDPRCRLINGDFFALVSPGSQGLDPAAPGRLFDAILVDIDHTPRSLLHTTHASFYDGRGLAALAGQLEPGGVFALWSADPPEPAFVETFGRVFEDAQAHAIEFYNAVMHCHDINTIYMGKTAV